MTVQERLERLAAEVEECGDCILNTRAVRELRPFMNGHWRDLFSQHASDDPVEMGKEDFEDFAAAIRTGLAACVASKLTA